jgi:hypothetical protein
MTRLVFAEHPKTLEGKPYRYFRDWLECNFYKELCSFCLIQHKRSLQIEHYEPQSFKPERINDPLNLLLACPKCNSGKRDYHPENHSRQREPTENRGFSVIDIREEDFASLYFINKQGEITPKQGIGKERAKFNATLLRLDIPSSNESRKNIMDYVEACEDLVGEESQSSKNALKTFVRLCAEQYLFIRAFDISISSELRKLIEDYLEANKPELIQ